MERKNIFEAMLKRYSQKFVLETGCDEAGRGCLAGPVYAAAVILPHDFRNTLLNDSKQLTEEERYRLRPVIEKEAVSWAIGIATHEEVDKINILNASFLAMHRAIAKLAVESELLLIDGNRFNRYRNVDHKCVIGGDGIYMSIAAASVLAKTYRDDHMLKLHEEFPQYSWNTNKGYATSFHRKTILEKGFSPYHRRTFNVFHPQLELQFGT